MKFLIAIGLVLTTACFHSCSDDQAESTLTYHENHLETHRQHIDYLKNHSRYINGSFDNLKKAIEEKRSSDYLEETWELLETRINTTSEVNRVYISDCMPHDSITHNTGNMIQTNGRGLSITADIIIPLESAIKRLDYKTIELKLLLLEKDVNAAMDKLIIQAENYVEFAENYVE